MGSERVTRVLLVEDHPIVRQGLAQLINQEPDLEVCGEAAAVSEAIEVVEATSPDLALIDISLKSSNGLELVKDLARSHPQVRTLVLSLFDEMVYAERVLRAGAKGYIMKAEATDNVMVAIRTVLAGEVYVSDRVRQKLFDRMVGTHADPAESAVELLSDRELEVFQMVGEGCGTRAIADRLNLSVKTIETYKSHIKSKLKLKDGTELIQQAVKWVMENRAP